MGHLLEPKCAHSPLNFIFNKCPIYTHDGASAKYSTNSHETDYSAYLQTQNLYVRSVIDKRTGRLRINRQLNRTLHTLNTEPVLVNVVGEQESISPAYVAWGVGTISRVVVPARQAGNRAVPGLLERSTNTGSAST